MLKLVDGQIVEYHADVEHKKLADAERQKSRKLYGMPKTSDFEKVRKQNLQHRQQLARELRAIKIQLKGEKLNDAN